METFRKKASVVRAVKYNGDLPPVKRALGIEDANYDEVTRDFMVPAEKSYTGDQIVLQKNEYLVQDESGKFFTLPEKVFLENYEQYSPVIEQGDFGDVHEPNKPV